MIIYWVKHKKKLSILKPSWIMTCDCPILKLATILKIIKLSYYSNSSKLRMTLNATRRAFISIMKPWFAWWHSATTLSMFIFVIRTLPFRLPISKLWSLRQRCLALVSTRLKYQSKWQTCSWDLLRYGAGRCTTKTAIRKQHKEVGMTRIAYCD